MTLRHFDDVCVASAAGILRLPFSANVVVLVELHHDERDGRDDFSWVFSSESLRRVVPLLRQVEAATRLQSIVTGESIARNISKTVLMRQSPISIRAQLLLLHSTREAFAEDERLLPGILKSYYRTLLFLVNAASSAEREPMKILRWALVCSGLATGAGIAAAIRKREGRQLSKSARETALNRASHDALASAEDFLRDVQHVVRAAGGKPLFLGGKAP
ncbi:hypothetical protein Efla_001641 [Eimeria flavescens]